MALFRFYRSLASCIALMPNKFSSSRNSSTFWLKWRAFSILISCFYLARFWTVSNLTSIERSYSTAVTASSSCCNFANFSFDLFRSMYYLRLSSCSKLSIAESLLTFSVNSSKSFLYSLTLFTSIRLCYFLNFSSVLWFLLFRTLILYNFSSREFCTFA